MESSSTSRLRQVQGGHRQGRPISGPAHHHHEQLTSMTDPAAVALPLSRGPVWRWLTIAVACATVGDSPRLWRPRMARRRGRGPELRPLRDLPAPGRRRHRSRILRALPRAVARLGPSAGASIMTDRPAPTALDVLEVITTLLPGTRSKADIDAQLERERAGWDEPHPTAPEPSRGHSVARSPVHLAVNQRFVCDGTSAVWTFLGIPQMGVRPLAQSPLRSPSRRLPPRRPAFHRAT